MSSTWPLITPLPGVSREHLRDSLQQLWTDVYNIRSGTHGSGFQQLARYLIWASGAVRTLANQTRPADIDTLILTRGYERLLTLAAPSSAVGSHTVSVMNEMLNVELSQRVDDLAAARDSLNDAINRWADSPVLILPDTSVYIEYKDKLADLDFGDLTGGDEFPLSRLVVLVPIVVIDELDRLKESKNDRVRWRATHTLGVIDSLFPRTDRAAPLRARDTRAFQGPIVMELIFDPPGHIRLPIEDDEIVDRALSVGALAESPVTLVTFDTGQSLRARSAGLPVRKLTKPKAERDEEDDPGTPSRRQVRRERQAAREATVGEAQSADNG